MQYPNVGNTEYTRTRHDIEYLDICTVIIDNDPVIVSISIYHKFKIHKPWTGRMFHTVVSIWILNMAGAGDVKYGPADSATQQRAQLPCPPVPAKCCDLVGTGQTTLGFLNLDFDTVMIPPQFWKLVIEGFPFKCSNFTVKTTCSCQNSCY